MKQKIVYFLCFDFQQNKTNNIIILLIFLNCKITAKKPHWFVWGRKHIVRVNTWADGRFNKIKLCQYDWIIIYI